jgi:hypothetical protein
MLFDFIYSSHNEAHHGCAQQAAGSDEQRRGAVARGTAAAFGFMSNSRTYPRIVLEAEGFSLEGIDECRVLWAGVRRITTHKLDLLTSDEVRLVFELDGGTSPIEVSEEQPGFEQLRLLVETKFGFPLGWWEAAMKPAFAANESILFVRAEQGHAGDAQNARA